MFQSSIGTSFAAPSSPPDGSSSSMVPAYYQFPPSLGDDLTTATIQAFDANRNFQPGLLTSQASDSEYRTQQQGDFFCTCFGSSSISNDGSQSTSFRQSFQGPWGPMQPSGSVDSFNSGSLNLQGESSSVCGFDIRLMLSSKFTERRVIKCSTCCGWRFQC